MTDYANMPAGREMDALVAEKVMNLCTCGLPAEPCEGWLDGSGCYTVDGKAPRYSRDIAAAWGVVEKLDQVWFAVRVCREGGETWDSALYEVFTYRDVHCHGEIRVSAETAPLAICRAALVASTR